MAAQPAQIASELLCEAARSLPALRVQYRACPLCENTSAALHATADCRDYPTWHAPLPESLIWLRCATCKHIFTDSYYSAAGLAELLRLSHPSQLAGRELDQQRMLWAPAVERVISVLQQQGLQNPAFSAALTWLDVGCGSGGLLFTAEEFGFAATGLDLREEPVDLIRNLGFRAQRGDLLTLEADGPLHVLSMADVLEHTPFPVAHLRRAHQLLHPRGVLYVSCPNCDSSSWREMDSRNANPYWRELEHHHNFSRNSLTWLLRKCGFEPVSYAISNRYLAGMETIAVKAASPHDPPGQKPAKARLGQEH